MNLNHGLTYHKNTKGFQDELLFLQSYYKIRAKMKCFSGAACSLKRGKLSTSTEDPANDGLGL